MKAGNSSASISNLGHTISQLHRYPQRMSYLQQQLIGWREQVSSDQIKGVYTMNKSQLGEALVKWHNSLTKKDAKSIVDTFFNTMAEALAKGHRIEIRGFGSFKIKNYQPYKGRNPKTGKSIQVKKKRLPYFKTGVELRDRVNK